MSLIKTTLLFLFSGLMFFASFVHSQQGWPEIAAELTPMNISEDLYRTLQMGWYFGSFTFFAFGILLLNQALRLIANKQPSLLTISVIAWTMLAFGTLGLISYGFSAHFFVFAVVGGLVAITGALPDRKMAT